MDQATVKKMQSVWSSWTTAAVWNSSHFSIIIVLQNKAWLQSLISDTCVPGSILIDANTHTDFASFYVLLENYNARYHPSKINLLAQATAVQV